MRSVLRPIRFVVGLALGSLAAFGQGAAPISAAGVALEKALDGTGVDHLWLQGHTVDWKSGQPDDRPQSAGEGHATHCSAFAAAFADENGIYLLHPPEHGQLFLASAQVAWLSTEAAAKAGWQRVRGPVEAQKRANAGELVVVAYPSPNPKKPGHIAIVRPSDKDAAALAAEGPQITQAGATNALSTTVKQGFSHHPGAFPDGVVYYAHALALP